MEQRVASDGRLRVSYHLSRRDAGAAERLAREIAYEQTVELPAACVRDDLAARVVGLVEDLAPRADGSGFRASISYDPATIGDETAQLLNLLFGNVSMYVGVKLIRVQWPAELLRSFGGPRQGIEGLRRMCAADASRPLLCAALKPIGLSAEQLAGLCHEFALGGMDIVKDDHGLADQADAPFDERVARCQEAVERANRETGGSTIYFPHLTGAVPELPRRMEIVRRLGCPGVLVSPLLVGPDTMRWAAEQGLAVLAHPALAGAYLQPDHGLAARLLLGDVFRILGADGVIYPNAGGRFPFSEARCQGINQALREPLGSLLPAFPVPGGGIDVERVPRWLAAYGPDTAFLIGGALYLAGNLRRACRELRAAVEAG